MGELARCEAPDLLDQRVVRGRIKLKLWHHPASFTYGGEQLLIAFRLRCGKLQIRRMGNIRIGAIASAEWAVTRSALLFPHRVPERICVRSVSRRLRFSAARLSFAFFLRMIGWTPLLGRHRGLPIAAEMH